MGTMQLSQFDNWDQLFTDATTIQKLPIQGLIITMKEQETGTTKTSILGGGGIVLENGESENTVLEAIKSTILGSANHLEGLKKVAKELHPQYTHNLRDKTSITYAKLLRGSVATDSCSSAQSLNDSLCKDISEAARICWDEENKL